jgi:hypothetical protein
MFAINAHTETKHHKSSRKKEEKEMIELAQIKKETSFGFQLAHLISSPPLLFFYTALGTAAAPKHEVIDPGLGSSKE